MLSPTFLLLPLAPAVAACIDSGDAIHFTCSGQDNSPVYLSSRGDIFITTAGPYKSIGAIANSASFAVAGNGTVSFIDNDAAVFANSANDYAVRVTNWSNRADAKTSFSSNGWLNNGLFVISEARDNASASNRVNLANPLTASQIGIMALAIADAGAASNDLDIAAVNAGANGIFLYSRTIGGDAASRLNVNGDVAVSGGQGIFAIGFSVANSDGVAGSSTIAINVKGGISSAADAIDIQNNHYSETSPPLFGSASSSVKVTGNIVSASGRGVSIATTTLANLDSPASSIPVDHVSASVSVAGVDARGDAIRSALYTNRGRIDTVIKATGDLVSREGSGVYSEASGQTTATVTSMINIGNSRAGLFGIYAANGSALGSSELTINASGDVIADGGSGFGILAKNVAGAGSGAVTITANNVKGTSGGLALLTGGLYNGSARMVSLTSNVTVHGSVESGGAFGVVLQSEVTNRASGSSSNSNMILHDVTASKGLGVQISNRVTSPDAGLSTINLQSLGTVKSGATAIRLDSNRTDQQVTVAGLVQADNGAAVELHRRNYYSDGIEVQTVAEDNQSTLRLLPGADLRGTSTALVDTLPAIGGPIVSAFHLSHSHLVLAGSGAASLDLARIDNRANAPLAGAANRISGFGTLAKNDASVWTLTGTNKADALDAFQQVDVNGGTLKLDNATLALTKQAADRYLLATRDNPTPAAPIFSTQSSGALTIATGAVLADHGASTVAGDVINSGTILLNPCPTCAGNVLNVTGNYAGNAGSVISIGTILGDDTSKTDRLAIAGNASGTSIIKVSNENGPGALTKEGIEIITIGGSSDATFTLSGNSTAKDGTPTVTAGAYAYRLLKGNASGTDAKDWYLRSQLTPVDPVIDPVKPELQQGSPVYEAYSQALLALNGVSTLQQRIGNRVWAGNGNKVIAQGADAVQLEVKADEAGQVVEGNGVWGRVEGAHNRIQPKLSTTDSAYNQNVFKLQAGLDGTLAESEAGSLIGGVYLQYVHGKTTTSSKDYSDGAISSDGYGFGGTLTFYGDKGFYLDAQAQATWYSSGLTTTALGAPTLTSGNDGFGYALSVEAGQRFGLNEVWSVTPQTQLVYSRVDFDSFQDAWGAAVSLDRGASLQGRLGVTLDHETSWQNANGGMDRAHVYGIANLYNGFLDGTRVDLAGVSLASRQDRLWSGLGLGGSYNWDNDKYSIYGEGLINTSLNNFGDSYSVKGNVGFRIKW